MTCGQTPHLHQDTEYLTSVLLVAVTRLNPDAAQQPLHQRCALTYGLSKGRANLQCMHTAHEHMWGSAGHLHNGIRDMKQLRHTG